MEKENTQKRARSFIIFFLVLAFAVSASFILNTSSISRSAAQASQYDTYTDDDRIEIAGTNYEITKYPELLYATRGRVLGDSSHKSFWLNTSGDDYIVEIVPRGLFMEENETLKIGKEWGYFISTKQVGAHLESSVLVFDVKTNTNLRENIDNLIVSVRSLFQYKYAYLEAGSGSLKFDLRYSASTETVKYTIAQSLVIALPVDLSVYHDDLGQSSSYAYYEMTEDYYLKDISFGASLFNEQELNVGNPGYDPYQDIGSYITSYDYTYNGKYREYGRFSENDGFRLATDAVAYGFGWVPVVGWAYGAVSLAYDIINIGLNINDAVNGHIAETEKGKLTVTNFYQNRDDQLRYYRDSNNKPYLTKAAGIAVNTAENKSFWFGVGDGAEAYFRVNHSALNGQEPNYTRFISEVGLKVVSKKGDSVVATGVGTFSYLTRESVYKEIKMDKTENINLLPHIQEGGKVGGYYFYFVPEYTSDYVFSINLNAGAKVRINGVEYSEPNITVELLAGTRNTVEIYGNENAASGDITVSPNIMEEDSLTVKVLANGYYLIKAENIFGIKSLFVDNQNIRINDILKLENEVLVSYRPVFSGYEFSPADELTFLFAELGNYYIVLKNTEAATYAGVTFSAFEPLEIILGQAAQAALNENYTFIKVNSEDMGQYTMSVINAKEGLFDYIVYDSGFNRVLNAGVHITNGVYWLSFDADSTYYIGICNGSISNNAQVIINKDEDAYRWEIIGGPNGSDPQFVASSINLPQGFTYEIYFYINGIKSLAKVAQLNGESYGFVVANNLLTMRDDCPIGGDGVTIAPVYGLNLQTLRVIPSFYGTMNFNSVSNGEDLVLNYGSIPANATKFSYTVGSNTTLRTVSINANRTHSLISNLDKSGYYNSPANVTITLQSIHVRNIFGKEVECMPSIQSTITFFNMFGGGNGTRSSPYLISNKRHFNEIAKARYYCFRQTTNLYFNNTPHNLHTITFGGEYDGNGYSLYNIRYTVNATPQGSDIGGLFGYSNGEIRNVYMRNLIIDSVAPVSESSDVHIGGIVGYNGGLLYSVDSYDSQITVRRSKSDVGGIAGWNSSVYAYAEFTYNGVRRRFNMYDCDIRGVNTRIFSYGDVGGIVGVNFGNLYSCYAGVSDTPTIILHQIGDGNNAIGGIVGYNYDYTSGLIVSCNNNANIEFDSNIPKNSSKILNPFMGKIVGVLVGSTSDIIGCAANGTIKTGNLQSSAGGSWFFGVGGHNQKMYVGSVDSQRIGRDY